MITGGDPFEILVLGEFLPLSWAPKISVHSNFRSRSRSDSHFVKVSLNDALSLIVFAHLPVDLKQFIV